MVSADFFVMIIDKKEKVMKYDNYNITDTQNVERVEKRGNG